MTGLVCECVCLFLERGGWGGGVRQHLVQSCKVRACVFVFMKMKSNEMEEIHEGRKFNSVISDIF